MRSAPNVHINGIAGPQTIIAGSGDVHLRLERQLVIIKDVAPEDFSLQVLLLLSYVKTAQRIFGHEEFKLTTHIAKVFILHLFLLIGRKSFTIRLVTFALREFPIFLRALHFFPFAKSLNSFPTYAGNILRTDYFLLLLRFVIATNATNALYGHPTFHELSDDLRNRPSVGFRLDVEIHDLLVGHHALCMHDVRPRK